MTGARILALLLRGAVLAAPLAAQQEPPQVNKARLSDPRPDVVNPRFEENFDVID